MTKFKKNRWYKGLHDGSFRRCSQDSDDKLPYSEAIFNRDKDELAYSDIGGTAHWHLIQVLEADLSEIQQYLPDGHIDKCPQYVKCISNGNNATKHQKFTGVPVIKDIIYKVIDKSMPIEGVQMPAYVFDGGGVGYCQGCEPSTKEEFDKQNMKEEFIVPEQWHIEAYTYEQAKVISKWFDESKFGNKQNRTFYQDNCDLTIYGGVSSGDVYGNKIGVKITYGQFLRHILNKNPMKKKIIGYKAPMDMPSWYIKKDDLLCPYNEESTNYVVKTRRNNNSMSLPKELVETWEAVYEEDQTKTLVLGKNGINVIISKSEYINVDNGNFILYFDIHQIYSTLHGRTAKLKGSKISYTVRYPKGVTIGCSEFELSEIKQIIDAYEEINK